MIDELEGDEFIILLGKNTNESREERPSEISKGHGAGLVRGYIRLTR